jgi:hypothetical protein
LRGDDEKKRKKKKKKFKSSSSERDIYPNPWPDLEIQLPSWFKSGDEGWHGTTGEGEKLPAISFWSFHLFLFRSFGVARGANTDPKDVCDIPHVPILIVEIIAGLRQRIRALKKNDHKKKKKKGREVRERGSPAHSEIKTTKCHRSPSLP